MTPPRPRRPTLAAPLFEGLKWKTVAGVVSQLLRAATGIVVARTLGPAEIGVAAMALTIAALGRAYADGGLGAAIVQRASVTDVDRSTAFWMTMGTGALLTVCGAFAAAPVARFFGEPRVAPLLTVASATFLIGALGTVQIAQMQREFRFRTIELSTMCGGVLGAVCALIVAVVTHSAWALIIQPLVGMGVGVALVWIASDWRPSARFSGRSLRELGGFSVRLLGTRTFFTLHRNADNIIVGKALGASALGAYGVAYNLMMLPFKRVVDPARAILFPTVARIQDDLPRVGALWLRSSRALAAALLPAMLGLGIVADDLVQVVLGPEWRPAVTPLRILAAVGVLHALIAVNSTVLSALGEAAALLRFSIVTFGAAVIGFGVGVRWGIDGVAAGYLAANVLVVPLYMRLAAQKLERRVGDLVVAIAPVLVAACGMGAAVIACRAALLDAPAAARLAACVLVGVLAAPALLSRLAPELGRDLRALWRSRYGEEGTALLAR